VRRPGERGSPHSVRPRVGADVLGRLRDDQGLKNRVPQLSHQLTAIGATERLGQHEQS